MVINYRHLNISSETYKLVTEDCVEDFLKHHSEMKGMNITQNFIVKKLVEYYLDQ